MMFIRWIAVVFFPMLLVSPALAASLTLVSQDRYLSELFVDGDSGVPTNSQLDAPGFGLFDQSLTGRSQTSALDSTGIQVQAYAEGYVNSVEDSWTRRSHLEVEFDLMNAGSFSLIGEMSSDWADLPGDYTEALVYLRKLSGPGSGLLFALKTDGGTWIVDELFNLGPGSYRLTTSALGDTSFGFGQGDSYGSAQLDLAFAAVPEPTTAVLLSLAGVLCLGSRRALERD